MAAIASTTPSARDLTRQAGLSMLGGLQLKIERGRHSGAAHVSPARSLTIGSGPENDVVLLADQLASRHVKITLLNPWTKTVRLEAQDQAVMLPDGRLIEVGHHLDHALPLRFRAGSAECRLDSVRDHTKFKRYLIPAGALLLAALVLPSVFGNVSRLMFGTSPSRPASVTTSAANPGADLMGTGRWQDMLAERVRTGGLTGQVTVERGASGNLVAVGMIEDGSIEKWREIVKWYDALGGGPLLVNNVTRSGAQSALPSFRSIWLDTNPQVVLQNGQTMGPGETIPGGWKIESIDSTGVLISREGRSARVTF